MNNFCSKILKWPMIGFFRLIKSAIFLCNKGRKWRETGNCGVLLVYFWHPKSTLWQLVQFINNSWSKFLKWPLITPNRVFQLVWSAIFLCNKSRIWRQIENYGDLPVYFLNPKQKFWQLVQLMNNSCSKTLKWPIIAHNIIFHWQANLICHIPLKQR